YLSANDSASFVATNSINQGTHVPTLWPRIAEHGVEIFFGYSPFSWSNNAAKNAGVTCTIIGLRHISREAKRLFSEGHSRVVRNINYYLVDGPDVIVRTASNSVSALPRLITGNAAYDGGHLFLAERERDEILAAEPRAERLILRASGTSEFVDGD